MENLGLYQDIAKRTQGDIYVGVVGPVRTGKSTFIKKFMDLLVIPNINNDYKKERAKDELPQSAGGKTIMTTEPKFVPKEAAVIHLQKSYLSRPNSNRQHATIEKGVKFSQKSTAERLTQTQAV